MRVPWWHVLVSLTACGLAEPRAIATIDGPPSEAAPPRFVEVALGRAHGCAREDRGRVYCWGLNVHGQLGDGTRTPRSRARWVSGLEDARSLSAADDRSCVARADRSVWCWGAPYRDAGVFEMGWRERDVLEPAHVEGITGDEVRVRPLDVCARDDGGEWRCPGPYPWRDAPCRIEDAVLCRAGETSEVRVEGTEGAAVVSGDLDEGCTVVEDEVRCWGRVPGGEATSGPPAAVPIDGTAGAVAVATPEYWGGRACAVHADGHVSCWGRDDWGELGRGIDRVLPTPQRVEGIHEVSELAAGAFHGCVLDGTSDLWCWGGNRGFAISSAIAELDITRPALSFSGIDHVATGFAGTCVVRAGDLFCSGKSAWSYDLDRPDLWSVGAQPWWQVELPEPVAFTAMSPSPQTDVGFPAHDACARLASGRVLCTALVGELDAPEGRLLTDAPSLEGADRLAMLAGSEVCGETASGWRCILWRGRPTALEASVEDVVPGTVFGPDLCAVVRGEVRCGDVRTDPDLAWRPVSGTEGAVAVRANAGVYCSIDAAGGVACWGASYAGVLGASEPVERDEALPVAGLPPIVDVALGREHACALARGGDVFCWGHRHVVGDGAPITFASAGPIAE